MSTIITFRLNGTLKIIDFQKEENLTPLTPVLRYLRDTEHLTGTKEGCGIGDCGACTICIAETKKRTISTNLFTDPSSTTQIHFSAVNSCLLPLAALNGKHIYTIEWLSHDGKAHPIQKAMIEKQGIQCGFCSPGMIMSAYAHYRNGRPFTREEILKTLSGNLCRCTGYESILQAMLSLGEAPRIREPHPIFDEPLTEASEREIYYEKEEIKYIKPTTIKNLLTYRNHYTLSTITAGSTDISILLKKGNIHPPLTIIDISEIPELKTQEEFDKHIYIGSSTNIETFRTILQKHYPRSEPYLSSFASLQIRNCGTIGGSISGSSPVGDIMPLLIALDAEITLRSENGRRSIRAGEFVTSYRKNQMKSDEIIESIIIPKPGKNTYLYCHKQSKRKDMDISTLTFCLLLETKGKTITKVQTGFGGVAAIPEASCSCEEFLTGKEATPENFTLAAEIAQKDFHPISDIRGSAEYRLQMIKNLFIKSYEEYESDRK